MNEEWFQDHWDKRLVFNRDRNIAFCWDVKTANRMVALNASEPVARKLIEALMVEKAVLLKIIEKRLYPNLSPDQLQKILNEAIGEHHD